MKWNVKEETYLKALKPPKRPPDARPTQAPIMKPYLTLSQQVGCGCAGPRPYIWFTAGIFLLSFQIKYRTSGKFDFLFCCDFKTTKIFKMPKNSWRNNKESFVVKMYEEINEERFWIKRPVLLCTHLKQNLGERKKVKTKHAFPMWLMAIQNMLFGKAPSCAQNLN